LTEGLIPEGGIEFLNLRSRLLQWMKNSEANEKSAWTTWGFRSQAYENVCHPCGLLLRNRRRPTFIFSKSLTKSLHMQMQHADITRSQARSAYLRRGYTHNLIDYVHAVPCCWILARTCDSLFARVGKAQPTNRFSTWVDFWRAAQIR